MQNNYYVYLHINLSNGTPFYVGKGNGNRCNVVKGRSIKWNKIVSEYGYDIIMLNEHIDEVTSLQLEKYWVSRIGRIDLGTGPLINKTNGGQGVSGLKHSDNTKKKLSDLNKGKKQSTETIEKKSKSNTGKKRTQELKDKMSKMFKGKTHSDEYRENCRQRQLGKPSNRKGKTRFNSDEERKEAQRQSNNKYKQKIKLLKNGENN